MALSLRGEQLVHERATEAIPMTLTSMIHEVVSIAWDALASTMEQPPAVAASKLRWISLQVHLPITPEMHDAMALTQLQRQQRYLREVRSALACHAVDDICMC